MFSGIVKVALTPVAIVKDVVNVLNGEDVDATKTLLEDAKDDVVQATDDLADGDL